MRPVDGWAVAVLVVSLLGCFVGFVAFMAEYRYRRGMTRWMRIPVPMSMRMWAEVLVLALSEAGVVVSLIVLLAA